MHHQAGTAWGGGGGGGGGGLACRILLPLVHGGLLP